MNRKTKELLKSAAESPDYYRKDAFIRKYKKEATPNSLTIEFILAQTAYINRYIWITSIAFLGLALYYSRSMEYEALRIMSALMPFLSMGAEILMVRSRYYGMSELESVTFKSLRGVYYARAICIGSAHMCLLVVLTLILMNNALGYLATGALITIPYLLTAIINTIIERKLHGKYNLYAYVSVAFFVSGFMQILHSYSNLIRVTLPSVWIGIIVALFVITCVEININITQEVYA